MASSCGKFSTGKNGSKAATELTSKATLVGAFFMLLLCRICSKQVDTFLIELHVGADRREGAWEWKESTEVAAGYTKRKKRSRNLEIAGFIWSPLG